MWERFRTGTGGAPGHHDSSAWNPTSRRQQQQQQQHHHQGQQGLGQQLPPSSTNINTNPNYSSSNSSNSWQPRSSVIAQRQRQQQQPQNQRPNRHNQQQQQLRSASADNYPGTGSAGGYGGYQYSIKGGPPPPRPLRDLCVASFLPPLHSLTSTHTRLPSALPECLRHHQLTHPRAILAKYRRLSNLLPANRPSPNSHKNNDNASYSRPAPTRDTTPATPSPAAQPRPSTPSPRRCTRPLRPPSATAPTSRGTNPTVLTTFLPRARPSCCPPEMCTSSPSLLRRASTSRGGTGRTEQHTTCLVCTSYLLSWADGGGVCYILRRLETGPSVWRPAPGPWAATYSPTPAASCASCLAINLIVALMDLLTFSVPVYVAAISTFPL